MDCSTGQELWPVMRGDTQKYYLTFTDKRHRGIDVSNKVIAFTMRLNNLDNECHLYDINFSMRIPNDANAKQGKVLLIIPAEKTAYLLANRTYKYDFQLSDDSCSHGESVDTLGWGNRSVMQDTTLGAYNDTNNFRPC